MSFLATVLTGGVPGGKMIAGGVAGVLPGALPHGLASWLPGGMMAAGMNAIPVDAGYYINAVKFIPIFIILLLWARLLTWADKDSVAARLPREWLNLGMLIGVAIGVACAFFTPYYIIGLLLFLVILAIEIGVYLYMRNAQVGLADLQAEIKGALSGLKSKKPVEAPAGTVAVVGADNQMLPIPQGEDPDRMAYDGLQQLLDEPLSKNAERVDLVPSDEGDLQMRYIVDGAPYTGGKLNRTTASEVIAYLKRAAKLNVEERRKPQTGSLRVLFGGKRRELEITTAGNSTGEFLKGLIDPKRRHAFKLTELGFSPGQLQIVQDSIKNDKGLVLVATPKGQGLTSLLYGLLRGHDAFVEHIQTVERAPDQDLEGVTQNELPANAPAMEEFKKVDWVLSQIPDVVAINQVDEPRSAVALAKFAGEDHRVYVAVRAGNTFDALAQWRRLVGDDKLAMKDLKLVIAGRVLRRLCAACKVAFTPDPEALRKLNINPSKASKLYAARKEPLRDAKGNPVPCEFCHNLRYSGRMGVFEVMVVNDEVRNIVQSGGSLNQLKAVFRKQRARFLQEEAFALVEAGETSVEEVVRAMKAGDGAAAPASSAPVAARKPAVR